jgi:Protein of unknown function (DUF3990)
LGVELVWQNDDLVLYHGCSEQSLQPTNPQGIAIDMKMHGINLLIGASSPDFGRGFYTTTWFEQAKNWANRRAKRLSNRHPGLRAVVLQFEIKRNDLAELEALVFTNEKDGYFSFISYCRQGGSPHGRSGCPNPLYDVVYGPVSVALQDLVIKDSDQVSFHTDKALSKIPAVSVVAMGAPHF